MSNSNETIIFLNQLHFFFLLSERLCLVFEWVSDHVRWQIWSHYHLARRIRWRTHRHLWERARRPHRWLDDQGWNWSQRDEQEKCHCSHRRQLHCGWWFKHPRRQVSYVIENDLSILVDRLIYSGWWFEHPHWQVSYIVDDDSSFLADKSVT